MPKETVKNTEKAKKSPEVVEVTSSTTDQEMLQFNQEGFDLKFEPEDFKERSDEVVRQLSYHNMKSYFVNKALWEQGKKQTRPKGSPRIEILDPLANRALDRINVKATDRKFDRKEHLMWANAGDVEIMKDLGYRTVEASDPVQGRLAKNASGHRVIRGSDSRDELVLMKLPKEVHEQHLKAVAEKSHNRMVSAPMAQMDKALKDVSNGGMRAVEEAEIEEKVEVNPIPVK